MPVQTRSQTKQQQQQQQQQAVKIQNVSDYSQNVSNYIRLAKKYEKTFPGIAEIFYTARDKYEKYMRPEVGFVYDNATFLESSQFGGIFINFGPNCEGFISTNDLKLTKKEKSRFDEDKVLPERLKNKKFMVQVIRADPEAKFAKLSGFYDLIVM